MNKHTSLSSAKRPWVRMAAFCMTVSLSIAAVTTGTCVAADRSNEFKTSFGQSLTWSPQGGYWIGKPGDLGGSPGQIAETLSMLNKIDLKRSRAPEGYSFKEGPQKQVVLSSGSKKLVVPDQPMPASASPRAATAKAAPANGLKYENLSPTPTQAAPQPYIPRQAVKGKPVPIPPMPEERRIAASDRPPVPKAVPYVPKTAPEAETPPAAKPAPARSGPKLIADAPPTAPLALPAPKPAIALPAGGEINGISEDMQKSFLSRKNSVFMIFDKEKGSWTSSPGALKDEASADQWCKQATDVDRAYGRIPANFTYHHLGGGQVQIRKD